MTEPEPEQLRVAQIQSEGGAAPWQAYGTLTDGREFYFRVRHQDVTLWAGPGPYETHHDQGRTIGFYGAGMEDDPHVWSYIDKVDAQAILAFLVRTLWYTETAKTLRDNDSSVKPWHVRHSELIRDSGAETV